MIVNNYNQIITCLHPVEEPLIKERIEKMDQTIEPALVDIKWKSDKISQFINTCKVLL
jgi:dynein heavy chain, axonemal